MSRARVYEVERGSIVSPEGERYARNGRTARRNLDAGSFREALNVSLVDTYGRARKVREDFYGREIEKEIELSITWPRFVRYVGVTNAEQYLSDKKLANWKLELFKHIAEDEQYLFINDAITTLVNDRGQPVEFREAGRRMDGPEGGRTPGVFYARSYEVRGKLPKHVAILAQDKGVQWVTADGKFWELRIPNCTLAAAPIPDSYPGGPKVFLFSYSPEGVHYIITGTKLNVTEDGIVH